MADISAVNRLCSTHSMPRKMPVGPVIQPRFSERARLRLAHRNRVLGQFPEGKIGPLRFPARDSAIGCTFFCRERADHGFYRGANAGVARQAEYATREVLRGFLHG